MLSILLVEDDRLLGEVIECYLTSLGISVLRVASVNEARSRLLAYEFDCIVLDYFLEGGTAKNVVAFTAVPIIVISGYESSFDPDLSVRAWVTKPFDLSSLERLVRRVCAQSA